MAKIRHSYFVVMRDFGRSGLEAIVQPELTRRNIIDRLKSGEWDRVEFIHFVHDGVVEDLTEELKGEASSQKAFDAIDAALATQPIRFDHAHDHRKQVVA